MNGKSKCKILKDIRRQIAQDNDIAFVTEECKYQGDCRGTCPKCEAELQYLENELRKRQAAGKAIAVAGIAATLMLGSVACTPQDAEVTSGAPAYHESSSSSSTEETLPLMGEPTEEELMGDMPMDETEPTTELGGEPPFYEEEPGVDDGDWGELH
jgi:hypothetical protein